MDEKVEARAQFTPGPWMAAAKPSSVVGWPVVARCGRAIASVMWPGIKPNENTKARKAFNEECHANAHLIAAAPELYEALNSAPEIPVGLLAFDDGFEDRVRAWFSDYLDWQFGAQCEAITKARGEKP